MKLEKIGKVYLLFFVLAVILTFSQIASAAQAPPALTVRDVAGFPEDQVVVPIQINRATSMDSFNIEVLYDPQVLQPGADGLGYVDRTGTLTANYDLFIVNAGTPGQIQIGAAKIIPTAGNGVLMKLLFTIKPDANCSSLVNLSLLNDPGNDLSNSKVTAGTVTVSVRPTVTTTTPEDNQNNIPLNTQITATFNKDMNSMTINRGTFTIKDQRNVEVPGTVTYNNKTATYKPSRALNPDTLYTATLTTKITDLTRNTLPANYVWQFTTEPPDMRIPEVVDEIPGENTNNAPLSTEVTLTFNKDMNPLTINKGTFTLKDQKNVAVPGRVTYNNKTATYKPSIMLSPNTTYTVTLTTRVADLNRQTLPANYMYTFTTEPPDMRTPTVAATTPEDNQNNIPLNTQITATFNKDMNSMTINRGTFTIKDQRNVEVPGTITYNNKTATYKPYRQLNPNTTYTATLTTKITDLNKQTLPISYVWRFTTL